jgi:hypothetical protein
VEGQLHLHTLPSWKTDSHENLTELFHRCFIGCEHQSRHIPEHSSVEQRKQCACRAERIYLSGTDVDNVPDLHGNPTEAKLVIFIGGNQFLFCHS